MSGVSLLLDMVRRGRITPAQGARLLELRREMKRRRAGRLSRFLRFVGHCCGAD